MQVLDFKYGFVYVQWCNKPEPPRIYCLGCRVWMTPIHTLRINRSEIGDAAKVGMHVLHNANAILQKAMHNDKSKLGKFEKVSGNILDAYEAFIRLVVQPLQTWI